MAVTIAIAVMTSFMRETASYGYIWTRMVIRMSNLESGGGYLSRSSCRYLFLGVLPLSVSGVQPVLPCRSVPYQIEEFVPCPFVFQKYS